MQPLDVSVAHPFKRFVHRNRNLPETCSGEAPERSCLITGFANSVACPAIEYKKEGQVFGIGCKIFTIAGPVILYGIFTSWGLGLIYWFGTLFK